MDISPFQYFVNESWQGFIFGLFIYFTVWGLTHWKVIVEKWF